MQQDLAPGVYIQEVSPSSQPIAGVGTTTAAFIGPAEKGPIGKPTFLTNWTQFQNTFGSYIPAPIVYVTHALRGFFNNGGTSCYFVRVGTAVRASLTLNDGATPAHPALVVTAKQEGVASNAITVAVQHSNIVSRVTAVRAQATLATASNNQATVTDANEVANFRPGDIVFLEDNGTSERATISSISGTTITFQSNLTNTYSSGDGTLRIADLIPPQRQIRVDSTDGIYPGSYIRISQDGNSDSGIVQSVERTNGFITLTQELANTYTMASGDPAVNLQTLEFTLVINTPSSGAENFANLSMDPRHPNYFATIIDSVNVDVNLAEPPSPILPPNNLPAVVSATALAGGANDDITQLQATHYNNGIDLLTRVDDINILCIPDRSDRETQAKMIAHCEKMQDRFAILDPQRNATPSNGIVTQRNNLSSKGGYGAIYYPRIEIANPLASGRITIPPSGHIAGVYARSDNTRGVFKAPANEQLRGVLDLERKLTNDEQGPLNKQGINVLRSFPGSGIVVWGARTIAPQDQTQWRYVNVRRLLLFIQESIQEGTKFAVFEPNNLALWQKVKRQVSDFLTGVWRDGGLFGATPEQAFRVRVDEELNPPNMRALGQLTVEVIVVPTTPAEFIVFRVIQDSTGTSLQE